MKIIKVQAPDGSVIKVEGPDDASDDDFIQQGQILYEQQRQIKETQAAKFPASPTGGIIEPKATGVWEQLKTMGRRGLQNVGVDPNAPILETLNTLSPQGQMTRLLQSGVQAVTSPLETASGMAEAVAGGPPNMYLAIGERDPEKFAEGATDTIMNTLPAIYGAKSAVPRVDPSRLMAGAGSARAAVAKMPPASIPGTRVGLAVAAAKTAARPVVNAGAATAEWIAKRLARGDKPPIVPEATPSFRLPITAKNLPLPIPEAPPLYTPLKRSTGPSSEIPFNPPAEPSPFLGELKPRATPSPEIEMPRQPTPSVATKPNFKAVEEAIAPLGNRAKQSTLRNVPRLVEEVPELVGVPKGPQFDAKLMDGFRRTEQSVMQAEDAIPRTATVPKSPVLEGFADIVDDYTERGLTKSAGQVESIMAKWAELPEVIPWETFRDMKRAFFKEGNANAAPMRRAYGVLMNSASPISERLAKANRSYSTVRRALENAGIDIQTGRRIRDVGKKQSVFDQMQERLKK